MLAGLLEAGRQSQKIVLAKSTLCQHGNDLGRALRERARFVDDKGIDPLEALQCLGILNQHSRLGAAPDPYHDRHRRGEAEGTGAGDDQHGNRGHQGKSHGRCRPPYRPGRERDHRDGDNGGNEIAGDPIGETLDRRSSPLGFRDHGDDLGEHGLVADAVCTHEERAGAVQGGADDRIVRPFLDGDGL